MSEKKQNAAQAKAFTISAIEDRTLAALALYKDGEETPEALTDAKEMLRIVKDLDEENQGLAAELVFAQGVVALAKSLMKTKSEKKRMKIFKEMVEHEAKDYAREHVESQAQRVLESLENHVERVKWRAVVVIGFLLVTNIAAFVIIGLVWAGKIKLPV